MKRKIIVLFKIMYFLVNLILLVVIENLVLVFGIDRWNCWLWLLYCCIKKNRESWVWMVLIILVRKIDIMNGFLSDL